MPPAPPDAADVAAGLAEVEQKEAERARWLAGPEAVHAREASRSAYADASVAEARELLARTFAEQLQALDADPARLLSEVKILETYGESVATVSDDGDGSLLEAGIPVRTEDENGDLRKVDLNLVATDGGFEAANPLAELQIPAGADEPIEVGDEGLAVTMAGADSDGEAQRFDDKNAYYPEVRVDTDLLVSPTASGVELFDQLRSPASPEALRFHLDLPPGGELRSNGAGGAEMVAGGNAFAFVSPPSAVDAQGTPVPVELRVEDSAIVLTVPHRAADFAYPILVDPAIYENYESAWYSNSSTEALDIPGVWQYSTNDPTEKWILHSTSCLRAELCSPSGRGLFISTLSGNLPANLYGQWYYAVPGATTYIPSVYPQPSATINPFWRHNYSCSWSQYPRPYDYDGAWDGANWTWLESDRAQWYGNAAMFTEAKMVVLGMSTGSGGSIPCWRNVMAGGVAVRLDDPEAPTITSVTGIPAGWVSDAAPFSITANVQDPGLGVRDVRISPQGAAVIHEVPVQNQCPGIKTHPCPAYHAAPFSLNADLFDEGEKPASLSAEDPTGEVSSTYEWQMRVDSAPPAVTLGGQLAFATEETEGDQQDPEKWDELSLPVYKLKIEAEDGSLASNAAKRSGVKSIAVFLDGKGTPEQSWQQSCPGSSCSMTQTYMLNLSGLAAGRHTLEVLATDQVGKQRERNVEFEYIPATGIKDAYVMQHFPLPDGEDHSGEEVNHGPELAVNLMNGNLVYHERDIEVQGPAVDLEVERFYNSQLPAEEDTEWGDGWTLAQTPDLTLADTGGSPAADEADLLDSSGAIDGGVDLPVEAEEETFDPALQAVLAKREDGSYVLRDETGETSAEPVFDESGRTEELLAGGYAKVDYDYEDGGLSEIAVEDPASVSDPLKAIEGAYAEAFSYQSSFGSTGSGGGQFKHPADVATATTGNFWVVDQLNNRVEEFSYEGTWLSSFGQMGSGNGGLKQPTSLAIDTQDSIWVADYGNNRIQKFDSSGKYLAKAGSKGTGNGQFSGPTSVAVDLSDNVWVADSGNGRLEKFNEKGQFLKVVGSKGSGTGQLSKPVAIDLVGGNVWVADMANDRVVVFDEAGNFVRQFGDGLLADPAAIALDEQGKVFVGDSGNSRVAVFSEEGEYLKSLGVKGSRAGRFDLGYPMGIALSTGSVLLVADSNNDRVQQWPKGLVTPDDPSVGIEVEDGLISSVEGEEAGQHAYEHDDTLLTAHVGPAGETAYDYDSSDRLTGVELPNGTAAAIAYGAYGRVASVTVDPAGSDPAKTTYFEYSDDPRRTVVIADGEPALTYDIGPDGSILRWWNTVVPPGFDNLSGSLYAGRETPAPISTGDHNLVVSAHSEEGIAAIEVVANGDTLVDEKHCQQDPETPGIECVEVTSEWVTDTGSHAPGILELEAIVTDRLGGVASERFWVNIPITPPPDPDEAPAPDFDEVLRFREEFGLDLDLDPIEDELALNDRIFDLIGAWNNPHTYLGEVARASAARWSVPMAPADVAEMEYRERYVNQAALVIPKWAKEHAPSTYGGYYVDNRAGGKSTLASPSISKARSKP